MNLTSFQFQLNYSDLADQAQQQWSLFYTHLMKRLKRFSRQAWMKTLQKLNRTMQRSLVVVMRALHLIEKTRLFKLIQNFSFMLVLAVQQDGLKLTGLLTFLGYAAWYLTITL